VDAVLAGLDTSRRFTVPGDEIERVNRLMAAAHDLPGKPKKGNINFFTEKIFQLSSPPAAVFAGEQP
jgi:hypothetical protein